jgi:hypothetical protein
MSCLRARDETIFRAVTKKNGQKPEQIWNSRYNILVYYIAPSLPAEKRRPCGFPRSMLCFLCHERYFVRYQRGTAQSIKPVRISIGSGLFPVGAENLRPYGDPFSRPEPFPGMGPF